jgi:hypothetical protein
MTEVVDKVVNWLRAQQEKAFCDDCIAEKVGLSRRQQAHRVTNALAATSDFTRQQGVCAACGEDRKV